ncbi:MAG TPA: response regulator transcription factor [Thermoanaerobaculia bacterium]|jgi:DNA-binding response OmpR family regulator|nr:response regulator transcription factor [Thermoanaerobaculia bacterium]
MARRILVVEDDRDIARLVELHLKDLGADVTLAHDGGVALEMALRRPFDLVILDLMLPGIDGLEICRRLRARSNYTPILMLTARSADVDRIVGLEIGADDYLTKPFNIRELIARVKALLRRVEAFSKSEAADAAAVLDFGELVIDIEKRKVTLRGEPIDLTAKEFDLLLQFARYPGRVYTRAQLLDLVWGYGHDGYEHTVNSHINRLRSKLEKDHARPAWILTVWGVGYKFADA